MNPLIITIASNVRKLPVDDVARMKASNLIVEDLPLIMQDEYNKFKLRKRNENKDGIDFLFIKINQVKYFLKGNDPKRPKKKKPKKVEHKQQRMKTAMTIGDMLKAKEDESDNDKIRERGKQE